MPALYCCIWRQYVHGDVHALAYFAGRLAESWLGYIAADIGYDFLVLVDTPLIRSPISSQYIEGLFHLVIHNT